ncbi:uncharacterized protein [Clytia hemisphaerica]|uniref:Uncharacterized protein n=1 Tax=Clytia hemisphaerica TaxID=252671 RepID=A0A7M5XKJ1_9CNID
MGHLIILVLMAFSATASDYHLQFTEDQHKYDEQIHVEKEKGIVIYRVPQHAALSAAHYLKDFNKRLAVMKVLATKTCYVSEMTDAEPSIGQIELGMEEAKGVFNSKRYTVEIEDLIPIRQSNRLYLSSAILNFCGDFNILDTVIDTEAMKEVLKKKFIAHFKLRRSKRLNVNEYAYCKNGVATMSSVMTQCYGKSSDHYEMKCKVNPSKTCIYKVNCSLTNQGWNCPGVHQ